MLNKWGTASVVVAALVMSACARAPVSQQEQEVRTFHAKPLATVPLDMSNGHSYRTGMVPGSRGDLLVGKYYNAYDVPIHIGGISFTGSARAKCSVNAEPMRLTIPAHSMTEIELATVSELAACDKSLPSNNGARFIVSKAGAAPEGNTRTVSVPVMISEVMGKNAGTELMGYPMTFDVGSGH